MLEKRKAERRRCDLGARILVFGDGAPSIECKLVDITDFGALVRIGPTSFVPRQFELMVGDDPISHPCRLARQTSGGVGIEFLDPIRHEIETSLMESVFKEELLIEASYGRPLRHSAARKRLTKTVEAMMRIIVERGYAPPHSAERA